MGAWQKAYDDDQREAVEQAWGDRGIRPASRIQTLAAAGELTRNGDLIPAFAIPQTTIRTIGSRYARQCEGRVASRLAKQPASDAVERLRERLVNATDAQLQHVERLQRNRQHLKITGEQLRQIARAIREIAAIPDPNSTTRPVQPGQHDPSKGGKTSGKTTGGLAGKIMASVGAHPLEPVQEPTNTHSTTEDPNTPPQDGLDDDDPAAFVRQHMPATL